ncbi:MAG: orotidine-5'-phosphate decarboxylase [Sumerlaeia bacterium]
MKRPCAATRKLVEAWKRTGSLLSVGLEPAPEYLPDRFPATIAGHEEFLRLLIEATAEHAAAYKFNLAFFESLGPEGWALLFRLREALPDNALILADAKRSDIGSTAKHYAKALYETLAADSATVNPLLGRDACEPFLEFTDKLTFFLVLTSNPGAEDFILPGDFWRRVAEKLPTWTDADNLGYVVGATRGELVRQCRALCPAVPFLIPGVGKQGGDVEQTARDGQATRQDGFPGTLFHVTRGILPPKDGQGDPLKVMRSRTVHYHSMIAKALPATATEQAHG